MPTGTDATKVVTGRVRLSYAHLFEKYKSDSNEGDAKYSCVILVPKNDRATIRAIEKAQQAALENGKDSKFGGRIPPNWKNTFRDGDDETEVDLERNPEYAGHMFMNVSSKTKPGLVDQDVNEIMDQEELYSGCYVRVSIRAFAYNTKGNKGVGFALNHVQKLGDGEFLGGRSKAEDDFDPVERDDDEGDDLI